MLSPRQTTPTTTLLTLRRQWRYEWRLGRYWGWSSPDLLFRSVTTAHATMSRSKTGTGKPWWTRAAATPQFLPLLQVTSCRQSSWPTPTPWRSSSTRIPRTQGLVGVSVGRRWHQVWRTYHCLFDPAPLPSLISSESNIGMIAISTMINLSCYDNMWGLVMKAVPKLDESESGKMVLK